MIPIYELANKLYKYTVQKTNLVPGDGVDHIIDIHLVENVFNEIVDFCFDHINEINVNYHGGENYSLKYLLIYDKENIKNCIEIEEVSRLISLYDDLINGVMNLYVVDISKDPSDTDMFRPKFSISELVEKIPDENKKAMMLLLGVGK